MSNLTINNNFYPRVGLACFLTIEMQMRNNKWGTAEKIRISDFSGIIGLGTGGFWDIKDIKELSVHLKDSVIVIQMNNVRRLSKPV